MPFLIFSSWFRDVRAIYFDPISGVVESAGDFPSAGKLTWISLSPADHTILVGTARGEEGQVKIFRINTEGKSVALESLGIWGSGGKDPAHHLILDDCSEVVVANYGGGSITSTPFTGVSLSARVHPPVVFPFSGPGPFVSRQDGSHPHQIVQRGPDELLVPDLGGDKVWRLGRLKNTGEWTIQGSISSEPGGGPRHLIVSGTDLYVVNELAHTLSHYTLPTSLSAEAKHHSTQTCAHAPGPNSSTAELLINPAGTHLYATNRDSDNIAGDTIAIYALTTSLLKLGAREPKFVKEVPTGMHHLRSAIIQEYEGKVYLVTAGAKGGGLKVYEIIKGGGDLEERCSSGEEEAMSFVWI